MTDNGIRDRIIDVKTMPLREIDDNPRNPKDHPQRQQKTLAGVLREVGWAGVPLAYHSERNGGKLTFVDGHLRKRTAPDLAVRVAIADLTDAEADYLLLTYDPIATLAKANREALEALLREVETDEPTVHDLLQEMADQAGVEYGQTEAPDDPGPQVDRASELQEKWQVERGQVWEIGRHRLMCGDVTDAEAVQELMGGISTNLVFTDPPYGVGIGNKNKFLNSVQPSGRNLENIAGDLMGKDELFDMLVSAFINIRKTMDDCACIYVTAPQGGELGLMMMMMMMAGLPVRHVLNWVKNAPTFSVGRLDYEYQHEPILYTWKKTHKHIGRGKHNTSTWFIDKPRSSKEHPTMKPIELVENAILNSSDRGQIVFDPFLGSGTTLVACEQVGRIGYGMEIEPKYCAVTLERLSEMGLEPSS